MQHESNVVLMLLLIRLSMDCCSYWQFVEICALSISFVKMSDEVGCLQKVHCPVPSLFERLHFWWCNVTMTRVDKVHGHTGALQWKCWDGCHLEIQLQVSRVLKNLKSSTFLLIFVPFIEELVNYNRGYNRMYRVFFEP